MMGALPKAMARRGHRVMVVAPRYANYEEGWDTSVRIQINAGGSLVEVPPPPPPLPPPAHAMHARRYRPAALCKNAQRVS